MPADPSPDLVVVAVVDSGQLELATCPLCHTTDTGMTVGALNAGGGWRCVTCHQKWSARRLETVAAYNAWVIARDGAHG